MISLEQKDELYKFLCKKINYGVHPINDIAQMLADHQMSSRYFGYNRLKNLFRDIPEFITLLPPQNEDNEMRVRFSIWHRPKTKTVVAAKKRRTHATPINKASKVNNTENHIERVDRVLLPTAPDTLLPNVQLDNQMMHLLALKTGRVEASLPGLLESSYQQAKASSTLDYSNNKLVFQLDLIAKNGKPVIVTFKRQSKPGKLSHLYTLVYIDDNDSPTSRLKVNQITVDNPAQSLENFAFLGHWDDFLQKLADMAIHEEWDFPFSEKKNYYILKKYIQYTFYRLQLEGKVLLSEDQRLAVFNTGLVDRHFDDIYACFTPNNAGESPWLFKEFCIVGHRGLGKQLVQYFNPLPQPPTYFNRKEDLLFDLHQEIHCDYDHILIENVDRFPLEFLKHQFYDRPKAMKLLHYIERGNDEEKVQKSYDGIRQIIEDDMLLYNRLKNRLDDAVLLAHKEVQWNFHSAVPSYYPARNTMNFMLPLHLTSNDTVNNVLVVELTPAGNYQGQTILTCEQAYIDARLVCSLSDHWLDPKYITFQQK